METPLQWTKRKLCARVYQYREGMVKKNDIRVKKNVKPSVYRQSTRLVKQTKATTYLLHNGPTTYRLRRANLSIWIDEWGVANASPSFRVFLYYKREGAYSRRGWTRNPLIYKRPGWSRFARTMKDRTDRCGKNGRWVFCRGERLTKRGHSWFSAKSMDVKPCKITHVG
jgi:hypothetical protein